MAALNGSSLFSLTGVSFFMGQKNTKKKKKWVETHFVFRLVISFNIIK